MLAAATVDVGWIAAGLIMWAVVQAASGVLKIVVDRHKIAEMTRAVKELLKMVNAHEQQLSRLREDRSACELRAAHQYAAKGEMAKLVGDQISRGERLESKIDQVHDRITGVAKEVAALRGKAGDKP